MSRLINADALMAYVTELYEYDLCHADADDYIEGRASAEHWIIEKIREMSTIDAIPIEWLKEKSIDACDPFSPYMLVMFAWHKWKEEQEAKE